MSADQLDVSFSSSEAEGEMSPLSPSTAQIEPAVKALPEQVAKLAAANEMLRSSLQTAHKDITSLLVQRDDLTAELRSTEGMLEEVLLTSGQWLSADMELTKRRQEMLREGIKSSKAVRARMESALARLGSGSGSGGAFANGSSNTTAATAVVA